MSLMQLHAKAKIYCISLFHGSICKVACKEFFDWPSWLTDSKIFYLLVSAKTAICCTVSCSLSTLCALMYMWRYTTCMHACMCADMYCKWEQFPVCQKHITKTTPKDKKQPPSTLHLGTHTYIHSHLFCREEAVVHPGPYFTSRG